MLRVPVRLVRVLRFLLTCVIASLFVEYVLIGNLRSSHTFYYNSGARLPKSLIGRGILLNSSIAGKTLSDVKTDKSQPQTKPPNQDAENQFFSRQEVKINPYNYNFVINGSDICTNSTELVIIVHSFHTYVDRREAIRSTWGSMAKGQAWPVSGEVSYKMALVFIFGLHRLKEMNDRVLKESTEFHDVIQGDFMDDYKNMTLKSLLELRWVAKYCPSAKYLLKSDDDMIINLPYLIEILHKTNMTRAIMGPYNGHSRVYRTGKWGVSKRLFPFTHYPPYESGAAYVISTDIVGELYETAEYVPSIHVDDVYITGILGKIIGANHIKQAGFAYWTTKAPKICDIVANRVITGTRMKPQLLHDFWKDIKKFKKEACR